MAIQPLEGAGTGASRAAYRAYRSAMPRVDIQGNADTAQASFRVKRKEPTPLQEISANLGGNVDFRA